MCLHGIYTPKTEVYKNISNLSRHEAPFAKNSFKEAVPFFFLVASNGTVFDFPKSQKIGCLVILCSRLQGTSGSKVLLAPGYSRPQGVPGSMVL